MSKKELFVPFDRCGNLLGYSYYGISESEKEICKEKGRFERFYGNGTLAEVFVPSFEFDGTLRFERFSRGRSSVRAHFVDCDTTHKYEMFISDFDDVIKGNHIADSLIKGTFSFVKKGQNYGIVLLKGGEQT